MNFQIPSHRNVGQREFFDRLDYLIAMMDWCEEKFGKEGVGGWDTDNDGFQLIFKTQDMLTEFILVWG